MNFKKVTSVALWALLGAALAAVLITHNIRGMLGFVPTSQTVVAHQRATATAPVTELLAPSSCDPYTASSARFRLTRETPADMLLQAAHETLIASQIDNYANSRRDQTTGAALLPPSPIVTGRSWATRNSEGFGTTWNRPTRELNGRPVEFLGLAELVHANPGRWSVRRHDLLTVDLPMGTPKPANTASTTWTLAPLRALSVRPRPIATDRYLVDITTASGVNGTYTGNRNTVELGELFTAPPATVPNTVVGISLVTRRVTWKVYAMAGMINIPRLGYPRPIQRACAVLPRINSTIAGENRQQIAALITELDGVGGDPATPSDLAAIVTTAHRSVTDALGRRLTPDQQAIDAANARADRYYGLYTATWNYFELTLPSQIASLENVLIGGNMGLFLLAVIFTLLALDMRRKMNNMPPPVSAQKIAEIEFAFWSNLKDDLALLRNLIHSYGLKDDPECREFVEMEQSFVAAATINNPGAFIRLAVQMAEGEINRLKGKRSEAGSSIGQFIDGTLVAAIRELCLAIIAAAEIKRPATDASLASLVGITAAALPHALAKAAAKALEDHKCVTTPSGEHRAASDSQPPSGDGQKATNKYRAADLMEMLCKRILSKAGVDVDTNAPFTKLVATAMDSWDGMVAKIREEALTEDRPETGGTEPSADSALLDELEELVDYIFRACGMKPMALDAKLNISIVKSALEALKTKLDQLDTTFGVIARTIYQVEPSTTELTTETDTIKLGEFILRAIGKLKVRISDGVGALTRKQSAIDGMKAGFTSKEKQVRLLSDAMVEAKGRLPDDSPIKAILLRALEEVHFKEHTKKTEKHPIPGRAGTDEASGEIATRPDLEPAVRQA